MGDMADKSISETEDVSLEMLQTESKEQKQTTRLVKGRVAPAAYVNERLREKERTEGVVKSKLSESSLKWTFDADKS